MEVLIFSLVLAIIVLVVACREPSSDNTKPPDKVDPNHPQLKFRRHLRRVQTMNEWEVRQNKWGNQNEEDLF